MSLRFLPHRLLLRSTTIFLLFTATNSDGSAARMPAILFWSIVHAETGKIGAYKAAARNGSCSLMGVSSGRCHRGSSDVGENLYLVPFSAPRLAKKPDGLQAAL